MHHPTDRIAHTTAHVTPVVENWLEQEIYCFITTSIPKLILLLLLYYDCYTKKGAGRSSEVERSLMVQWVVGLILHGVDPLSYFSFQPMFHDWCNKGRGMCYPVWDGAYKRTLDVNR